MGGRTEEAMYDLAAPSPKVSCSLESLLGNEPGKGEPVSLDTTQTPPVPLSDP